MQIRYTASIVHKGTDHLTLEGGGLEDFQKNFLQPKEKEKKIMQHTIEKKKYHAKESAQKKIPACKSTEAFHFSIVSTGLQDFAFLSRHIC
jgi:thermostable 8-oxoguanine DNA glycosylase